MNLIPADDPRLQPYRDIGIALRREPARVFVAEGEKIVRRLWASDFVCDSVLVSEKKLDRIRADVPSGTELLVVRDETMLAVFGFKFHSGVMATGVRRPWPTLGAWLSSQSEPKAPSTPAAVRPDLVQVDPAAQRPAWKATHQPTRVLLVLPEISDPLNLGAILRNAAGFGVAGVLLGPHCRDALTRQSIRTSMGTIFTLPICRSDDLAADLARLRVAGFATWATVLDDSAASLATLPRPPRVALLLGNEGPGLPADVAAACDAKVTIPMHNGTDSLNVAAASAVFLYELTRGNAVRVE